MNGPGLVSPYAGQNQQTHIAITRPSLYQQEPEEGCWAMLPYASLYPPPTQGTGEAWVPPPVKQTDIYTAQQTWPL
jgi:hypothetical protein